MFYPAKSLKRGGRFFFCWVADSWPLRFANITQRQLWSQDVRKICDDLIEILSNESGHPMQRFSLRLSSQLLRGLVRLYQKKVNVLLSELCMIHANVIKNTNKKWNKKKRVSRQANGRPPLPQLDLQEIIQQPQDSEKQVEEMIQASGNAVVNIEDITLREADLIVSDMLLKPNDGFGEENADETLRHLQDRTMEQMLLGHDVSHAQSGVEPARESVGVSHDKSRLQMDAAQIESILEQDITMFNKDIPDISVILPPEISIPLPEKHQEVQEAPGLEEPRFVPVEKPESPQIELEELLEEPYGKRRRLRKKIIIDKRIKISPQIFRERIENPLVELRCQDSFDDVISIRVPTKVYFRRPTKGGDRLVANVGFAINELYMRNLGAVNTQPLAERETEAMLARSRQNVTVLEKIDEELESPVLPKRAQAELEPMMAEINVTGEYNITDMPPPRVSVVEHMEVDTEALTQNVQRLSPPTKRSMELNSEHSPKRQRSVGSKSYRSELNKKSSQETADQPADKENRSVNLPSLTTQIEEHLSAQNPERFVSSLLQEAGLADKQDTHFTVMPEPEIRKSQRAVSLGKPARVEHSDGSETPLGSLDRTKVSLGDSDKTTDSINFIREQWGTEGTMLKILKLVNGPEPVTVPLLIEKGPVVPGHIKIIAARCFTSILKLKQHGFINVCKEPVTLEIKKITLGIKLRDYY